VVPSFGAEWVGMAHNNIQHSGFGINVFEHQTNQKHLLSSHHVHIALLIGKCLSYNKILKPTNISDFQIEGNIFDEVSIFSGVIIVYLM